MHITLWTQTSHLGSTWRRNLFCFQHKFTATYRSFEAVFSSKKVTPSSKSYRLSLGANRWRSSFKLDPSFDPNRKLFRQVATQRRLQQHLQRLWNVDEDWWHNRFGIERFQWVGNWFGSLSTGTWSWILGQIQGGWEDLWSEQYQEWRVEGAKFVERILQRTQRWTKVPFISWRKWFMLRLLIKTYPW